MMLRTIGAVFISLAILLPGSAQGQPPTTLRVSAIPDEAPSELLRKFTPLGVYLEKRIGMKVTFVPVTDYAATVEGLAARRLDLVWFGGVTFLQARMRTGTAIPLVLREEDTAFHSKFIARADAGIRGLADLKGKSFVFGSEGSTSGHLMPRYFLRQKGIIPERDFKQVAYSGAHDATAKWVEAGRVDAGALNESVWEKLVADKKVDPTKVTVFWTTPPYVDYVWTARGDLDPTLVERLRRAFLDLEYGNAEHRVILDLQRAKKYLPAKVSDWDDLLKAARAAGIIKP